MKDGKQNTKMRQDYGKDTSGDVGIKEKEAQMGRTMKGGPTDVSHSISGASAKR